MLISAKQTLSCLVPVALVTLAVVGTTTAVAQPGPADLVGVLRAIAAIREGQGNLGGGSGSAVWHLTAGDVAAMELARAASIPHRVVSSGGETRCAAGYDATVNVQSGGPSTARVKVALSCVHAPDSRRGRYYFGRYYDVARVGAEWVARLEGFEITTPGRLLPNLALERAAGSHPLAEAAQRER